MVELFENNQELYKVSPSTKKLQVWKGWTQNEQVFCSWGEFGGKLQEKVYSAEGKNIGKVNETSASEQAKVELQAMYAAQIKNKHYKCSLDEATESAKCCRIPRKITDYKKRYDKMSDVLLSSVKKNGSRCCIVDGVLYSKAGLPEDIKVDHLRAVLDKLNTLGEYTTFDAEVYAEGLSLQRIRSAWLKPIKTSKEIVKIAKDVAKKLKDPFIPKDVADAINYLGYNPNRDAHQLKFFVFDIPDDTGMVFKDRVSIIHEFEAYVKKHNLDNCFEFLYPVETKSHEERMKLRDKVCAEGSEGLVHYEPLGVYEYGKRSKDTANKPRVVARSIAVSCVIATCPNDTTLTEKARKAAKGFKRKGYSTTDGRRMSKEELSDTGKFTKPVGELERKCNSEGNPVE